MKAKAKAKAKAKTKTQAKAKTKAKAKAKGVIENRGLWEQGNRGIGELNKRKEKNKQAIGNRQYAISD